MKLFLFLALGAAAFAQAPTFLPRVIYREATTFVNGYLGATVVLKEDGTYTTVLVRYTQSRAELITSGAPIINPENGTFVYEKTGPATATLSFSANGTNRTFAETGQRTLVFSKEDGGRVTMPVQSMSTGDFAISPTSTALLNVSTRGFASASKPLIAGFVVGEKPRDVLIRAAGPALLQFGVSEAALDVTLEIVRTGFQPSSNDDWEVTPQRESTSGAKETEFQVVTSYVGAFPFASGSKDAALLIPALQPGAWTVVVRTKSETMSEVLAEVYVIP